MGLALVFLGSAGLSAQSLPSVRAKVTAAGASPASAPHQPILALPPSGPVSANLTAQAFNFTPTTYSWSQVAPSEVLLQHVQAAKATVDFSATSGSQVTVSFPSRGIYQLLLTASDGVATATAPVWVQVWDRLSGFNPLQRIGRNPGLAPPASIRQLAPDPGPYQHPRLLFTKSDWSELNAKTTGSTDVASALSSLTSSLNGNFDKTSSPIGSLRTYANALAAWADGGFSDALFTSTVSPVRQFGDRVSFGNDPGGQFPDALLAASYLQWVKVNPTLAQNSVPQADQDRFRFLAKVASAAARAEMVRVRMGASDPTPPTIASAHDMAVVYDLLYDWMTTAQRNDFRDYLYTIGYGYYNTGTGGLSRSFTASPSNYLVNGDFPNQSDPAILSALVIEGEESSVTPGVVTNNVAIAPVATGPAAWPYASPASVWNVYRMARWYSEDRITPWGSPLHHHAYLDFSTGFSGPAMLALARRGQNLFVTSNLYQASLHAFNNLNPRPSDGAMVLWDHHDSLGFGNGPNVYAGRYVTRYMYPDDPLIDFVYKSFRTEISSPLLTAIFHVDRTTPSLAQTAQSKGLSLTRFDPYRGAGVTRNSWSQNDLSLYFECRPDVQGHMHAEANNFSLYALGRAWASPPGYHVTPNEAVSTVLIQNSALAATDSVTDGFVGQSPSSSTTNQTRSQFPTPPGKFLEAAEDPGGQWALFAGDATAAYQYAYESGQTAQDTGRRIADFFYGDVLSQMYAGYDPAADTSTLKLGNLAYNPVQFAIRSVLTIRGSKPYVLVIDDIAVDGSTPRNYRWNMSAAVSFGGSGGRFVDANNNDTYSSLRMQSGATSTDAILYHQRDASSGPRLLVRDLSPTAAGQPSIFLDTRPADDPRGALTYGYDNNLNQFIDIPTNRVLIPRNNVVKPDYKVLLFPHQSGESLPLTSWNSDKTVATIDLRNGFTDRLTFDSTRTDKRTRVIRFTRTLSGRSEPTLVLPADMVVQASASTLSFTGQPGAAPSFIITATSDTNSALTPSVSSPSGTIFPVGTNTVYVTATDSAGQITSGQFTVTVIPAAPEVTVTSATNLAASPAGIGLRWNPVSRATAYSVKRTTTPGGPYMVVSDRQSASALTYVDSGLPAGTYYYIVTSWLDSLEGTPSAEIPLTVSTSPFSSAILGSQNAGFGTYKQGSSCLLTCTGGGLGGFSEQASFLSIPWDGDGVFTARLATVSGIGGSVSQFGSYGILMKQNTTPNSPMVASVFNTFVSPLRMVSRATAGSSASSSGVGDRSGSYPAPMWLRLSRSGNVFTSFYSTDGSTWTPMADPVTVSFTGSTLVGLAAGGQNTTLTSVVFDNLAFVRAPSVSATLSSVTLDWTGSVASSFNVLRGTSPSGPFTPVATGQAGTTYTDNSVTSGQTYYYVVSALGETSQTTNSSPVQVALLVPGVAGNLVVSPGFTTNTLSWTAGSNAVSSLIKRATSPGGPYATIATVPAGTTTFTDSGLVSGTTYYYIVTTTTLAAESAPTAEVSGVPTPGMTTKANNSTSLDQAASWTPSGVPTALDSASWNGTYSSGVASIGSGLAVKLIQILSPSTSVTINTGTGNLTLGSGGLDLSSATQSLTINPPVVLAANQTWNLAASRVVNVNSSITDVGSGASLTISGNGSVVFAANNTFTGPTTLAGGTLHLGVSSGNASSGTLGAGNFTMTSGTLRSNRSDAHSPISGVFSASGGTLQINSAGGNLTLNSTNLPTGSNSTLTTITGASGATLTIDGAPGAALSFGSSAAGFSIVLRNGNVSFNTSTPATNLRVEGGAFTSTPTDRFQFSTDNQTVQVTGGTVNVTAGASFGFRVGASNSASQTGARNVAVNQTGGSVSATSLILGGTDTTASRNPFYALSGGNLILTGSLTLGADIGGNGSSTFALSGGTLKVPSTVSGAQSAARQIFAMNGGTLAAATLNFTNLRSGDILPNGVFNQSGGTLAPGDLGTAGRTSVTGNYTLGGNATIAVDLGGVTQATGYQTGQYDYVTVNGTTSLAGALRVGLLGGFTPSANATFTILNSTGALTGNFSNVPFNARIPTAGGEGSFLVIQTGNTVQLSQYLNALQTWRFSNFGSSTNNGTAADNTDADGDGLTNLTEYALGSNPLSANPMSAPAVAIVGSRLNISFPRARPDVTYIVEVSPDLSTWTTLATNPGTIGQSVAVSDSLDIPSANPPRRFLRLRITSP